MTKSNDSEKAERGEIVKCDVILCSQFESSCYLLIDLH